MNKQELLNDLESKDFVLRLIGEPELQRDDIGYKWYTQQIFENLGDSGRGRTIHFYVLDEGEPEEKALYKDSTPKSGASHLAWSIRIMNDVNNVRGRIKSINEDARYAIVEGFKRTGGNLVCQDYVMDEHNNSVRVTEITE